MDKVASYNRRRELQRGFGLVDAMIYMSIAAVVLIMVFKFGSAATSGTNTNSLFAYLQSTHSAASTWKSQMGYYDYSSVSYSAVTGAASGSGANPEGGDCILTPGSPTTELVMTLTNITPTTGYRVANAFGTSFTTGQQRVMATYSSGSETLTVTYES